MPGRQFPSEQFLGPDVGKEKARPGSDGSGFFHEHAVPGGGRHGLLTGSGPLGSDRQRGE